MFFNHDCWQWDRQIYHITVTSARTPNIYIMYTWVWPPGCDSATFGMLWNSVKLITRMHVWLYLWEHNFVWLILFHLNCFAKLKIFHNAPFFWPMAICVYISVQSWLWVHMISLNTNISTSKQHIITPETRPWSWNKFFLCALYIN